MRVWVAILIAVVGAVILAIALLSAVGTSGFRARYEAEKAELLRRARAAAPGVVPAPSPTLPPPVRRYLEVARAEGRPLLRAAVVRQRGAIRTGAGKPWMPFDSEQVYSMEPPGFVWLARARAAPLVHIMARDAFVGGKGNMFIRLLGAVTVADARGPGIDQGAGLRYWSEAVLFPEMALDPHLRWEPLDDRRARMTVVQDDLTMPTVVEFDGDALPIATHAERYRDVGGRQVLTPWSGYSRDWKLVDGRLFPTRWESVWHLPEGDLEAVRMEILGVATE